MDKKVVIGSFGALMYYLLHAPGSVKTLAFMTFFMLGVDTLTGLGAAIVMRELRSTMIRTKLVAKLIQYSILMAFAVIMTILTDSWWFTSAGFWSIMAIEATSMLENLVKMQRYGGVKLGAITPILVVIEKYFATADAQRVVETTTTTVLPADGGQTEVPVISTTTTSATVKQPRRDGE